MKRSTAPLTLSKSLWLLLLAFVPAAAWAPANDAGFHATTRQPGQTQHLTAPGQVPEGLAQSDWASIRKAYEAGRHAFQPVAGQDCVWQARNPGQR